jgi:hypothetical protein
MIALRASSAACVGMGTLIYLSLQFKFVRKSLEDLNDMDNSDSQIEHNKLSTLAKQHTCEKSNNRNIQSSSEDVESFQSQSETQIHECCNKQKNTNTSIPTDLFVKEKEHKTDSDRLPSDDKSSPEDCVITIIKNHLEVIS